MRRDAKLGLAIGGVLIAVFSVYLIVVLFGGSSGSEPLVEEISPNSGANLPPVAVTNEPAPVAPVPLAQKNAPELAPVDNVPGDARVIPPAEPTVARPVRSTDWNALLDGARPLMSQTPPLAAPAPEFEAAPVANRPADPAPSLAGTDSAPAPLPARAGTHVVANGETLSSISITYYGSGRFWKLIADANPGINPNRLKIGKELAIPDVRDVAIAERVDARNDARNDSSAGDQPAQSLDTAREYRVVSGDSLYKISKKLYGDAKNMNTLHDLNRAVIGEDASKLKIGMILKLPEAPTATAAR